jgi:hypothetical protein
VKPPARHWRSHGNDPLPTGAEALLEPFAAFPSWFLLITCDRCGKVEVFNEALAYAPCRSAIFSIACTTTAAVAVPGAWSCCPAKRASAAGRFGASCCGGIERSASRSRNCIMSDALPFCTRG